MRGGVVPRERLNKEKGRWKKMKRGRKTRTMKRVDAQARMDLFPPSLPPSFLFPHLQGELDHVGDGGIEEQGHGGREEHAHQVAPVCGGL
jgi:hypothetical protein